MNLIKRMIDKFKKNISRKDLLIDDDSLLSEEKALRKMKIDLDKPPVYIPLNGSVGLDIKCSEQQPSELKVLNFNSKKTYRKYKSQQKNWSKWKRRYK